MDRPVAPGEAHRVDGVAVEPAVVAEEAGQQLPTEHGARIVERVWREGPEASHEDVDGLAASRSEEVVPLRVGLLLRSEEHTSELQSH